jgi:hypothetical protein
MVVVRDQMYFLLKIYMEYCYVPGKLSHIMVMVFNATFNNISVILWLSVLLVEVAGENH